MNRTQRRVNRSDQSYRTGRRRALNKGTPGVQALKLLNQSVTHVNGPVDPLPINNDVVVTKRVELSLTSATPLDVTGAKLSTALQASVAYFDTFRIQKISAYDEASTGAEITVDFPGFDGGNFVDRGTAGQRRPQLHLSPTFSQRSTWGALTDTATLFTATAAVGGVLQVTIQVRSAKGSSA